MNAINATAERNRGLTGRTAARRMREACLAQAGADGRIPITIEIVFGIGWAGAAMPRTELGGPIEVPLDRLGGRRRAGP